MEPSHASRRRSPLNTVLTETIRTVAADEEDRISQIGVGAAIDELMALDTSRVESWYLEGFAYGFGMRDSEQSSTDVALERRRIVGVLDAAFERRDHERLAEVGLRHPAQVREIVESGDAEAAVAPMLLALLRRHPERATALAGATANPFVGWETFLARAEERGRSLRDAWEPDRAAVVVTGLAGVVAGWRAAGATDPRLASMARRLTVTRASIHREAGDFETAEQLLDETETDGEEDGDALEPAFHLERALVGLRIARPDDPRISRAIQGDVADLAPAMSEARPAVAAALEANPDEPVAHLLGGVLALVDGSPADALTHLEVALPGLGRRVRPSFRELVDEFVEGLRVSSPSLLDE